MRSVVQRHTANSWQSWNWNPSSSAHPTPVSSMITNDRPSMPFPGQPLPNTTHSPLAVSRGQLSSRERSGDQHLVKEPSAGSEKCATDLQPSPGHLYQSPLLPAPRHAPQEGALGFSQSGRSRRQSSRVRQVSLGWSLVPWSHGLIIHETTNNVFPACFLGFGENNRLESTLRVAKL